MSRSFHPPDTLTKQDVQTIGEVRREIWMDGFYGMALGSMSALVLHSGLSWLGRYRKLPFALTRNTAMAWFLGGGALGSLIFSTAKGKNEVHNLHPIFGRGAKPPSTTTPSSLCDELAALEQERALRKRIEDERVDQERNRLFRRTTLQVRP